jgi:hypothetical protein
MLKMKNNFSKAIGLFSILIAYNTCVGIQSKSNQLSEELIDSVSVINEPILVSTDTILILNGLESFHFQPVTYNRSEEIPFYCGAGFAEIDSTQMIDVLLDSVTRLKLHTYKYIQEDYDTYHDEYFSIGNRKIRIDSLCKKAGIGYALCFREIDFFRWGDSHFILLNGGFRMHVMNGERFSYILMQLKNNQLINVTLFPDGYSDKNVFGDYNNDGILDYLDWETLKDTIHLYSLTENEFVKDKTHYIIVEMDEGLKKYTEQYGDILEYYRKVTDFNWFYPLI